MTEIELKKVALMELEKITQFSIGSPFVINDDNRDIVTALFYWFTRNPHYVPFVSNNREKFPLKHSLSKGLLLIGNIGSGKSTLMQGFKMFSNRLREHSLSIKSESCPHIVDTWTEGAIDKYSNGNWFFDELGNEDLRAKYSKVSDLPVMAKILTERDYNRNLKGSNIFTFATSNLSIKLDGTEEKLNEFDKTYGKRLGDRIYNMFNIVILTGETSFRRK